MSAPADCTVSLLTSPTAGAIAAVRLHGPGAQRVALELLRQESLPEEGRAAFRAVYDGSDALDEAVVLSNPVSTTHTGTSDIVICVHGGTRIVERLLARAHAVGCDVVPPAPSTFFPAETIVVREALDSLHLAKTPRAVEFLLAQRQLLPVLVREAEGLLRRSGMRDATWADGLRRALAGYESARRLLHGTRIALIGPTNAGKSTLFNRLAGRDAAVTSDRVGTTRDYLEAEIEIGGFPATLIDTAGSNVDAGEMESRVISAGAGEARMADLRVLVLDATARTCPSEGLYAHGGQSPDLIVWNKTDRREESETGAEQNALGGSAIQCRASAQTGDGVADLIQALEHRISGTGGFLREATFFTSRQRDEASAILAMPNHTSENVADELARAFL